MKNAFSDDTTLLINGIVFRNIQGRHSPESEPITVPLLRRPPFGQRPSDHSRE